MSCVMVGVSHADFIDCDQVGYAMCLKADTPLLTMTRWAVSCVMVGVSCAVFIDCDQVGCVVSRWVCNVLFLLTDQVGYAMCLVGV